MSPVEQSRGHVGRAATVALVGIVVMVGGLFLAAKVISPKTGSGVGDVKLGDTTFQGGSTQRLAKEIAERGPIVYGDVSGRKDRDIILQHLGDDPDVGWHAFLAAPLDKGRDCTWQWQAGEELFRAKCEPFMLTVLLLALYTGQRRQDLVRMTWKDFQGSIIRVRQNKTGEPLMIPCHKDLRAHLDGLTARFGPIIRAADGKTLNANALSSAMNRAVAAIDNMPRVPPRSLTSPASRKLATCR